MEMKSTYFCVAMDAYLIQALVQSTFKGILTDREMLQKILAYHIVPEELNSHQLYNNRVLETQNADEKLHVKHFISVSIL